MEFDKLKNIWKMADNKISQDSLSIEQINAFKQNRTKSITTKVHRGIIFNQYLIAISILTLLYNIWVYSSYWGVVLYAVIAIVILGFIFKQHYTAASQLKMLDAVHGNMHDILTKKLNYFKTTYQKLISTVPLVFVFGVSAYYLVYFYNEYGKLRPFDLTDFIVFGFSFVLIYVMSYVMFQAQTKNFTKEYETYLSEIDNVALEDIQRNEKRLSKIRFLFGVILGLICLAGIITFFVIKKRTGI